jgi:hypothetical protein
MSDTAIKEEMAARFPWIDPTLGYPDSTLREGVEKVESRVFAFKIGVAHKAIPWMTPCHEKGMEKIDGFDWEPVHINLKGTIDGQDYFWGMPVLGLGLMNVMVPAAHLRPFTDKEKKFWSGRKLGMFGSHSGDLSYTFNMPEM